MLGSGTARGTGIHVGAEALYAVELSRRRSRVFLARCATVPLEAPPRLPEQLADDDGRARLVAALRDLKARGVEGRRPFFSLAGTATFVKRRFALPGAEAETREQLLWEARQLLEEDLDDYVVDVHVTRRYGFIVAARRQILELYGVLCREAGVERPGFDMTSFALCNALEGSGAAADRGTDLIACCDPSEARLVLLRDGEYEAESSWAWQREGAALGLSQELARLCAAELTEGERADRMWTAGTRAPADDGLLSRFASEVMPLDPFAGLTRTADAEADLDSSGLQARAFAVAAGLAYRALTEA